MSSTPTVAATGSRSPARAPRWKAARPEIRIGIDFDDLGFRLVAVRLAAHCTVLDAAELKVEWLHRVAETAPDLKTNLAAYLEVLASRLPRSATRGGIATSIAMPPAVQSMRCVPTTQLADAERGIAEELGGAIQCRSWPVGSQKSMICGVRRDVAESLVAMLGTLGYRCESILPRSIALGRSQLSAPQSPASTTLLCWGRDRCLVTMIHDRSIRLCREFVALETSRVSNRSDTETDHNPGSCEDQLSKVAIDVANELGLTLQHALRLDDRTKSGPIIVCGAMSAIPGAIASLQAAIEMSNNRDMYPWNVLLDAQATKTLPLDVDPANAVAGALAIGGSKIAINQIQVRGKHR